MRRRIFGGPGLAVAVCTLAASAYAAMPLHGTRYKGRGTLYTNKSGAWKSAGTESESFRTSRNGRTILRFRGNFSTWCGGSGFYVTAREMFVSRRGTYYYRFSLPNKTAAGRINGRDYYWIYGRFFDSGRKAHVNYFFDYVAKGKTVRHPYDTAHPGRLGCASWVRGVGKAG